MSDLTEAPATPESRGLDVGKVAVEALATLRARTDINVVNSMAYDVVVSVTRRGHFESERKRVTDLEAQLAEVMAEVCRLQPDGSPPPGGLANHAAWCVQHAQAQFAAATEQKVREEVAHKEALLKLAAAVARAEAAEASMLVMCESVSAAKAAAAIANARAERADHWEKVTRTKSDENRASHAATFNAVTDALRDDLARVTADLTKSQERRAVAEDQASGLFAQNVRLLADLATARAEAEALKTRLHDANNALFVASAKKSMAEKSVRELVAGLRECRMHAVGYAPESLVAKIDALLTKHAADAAKEHDRG